MKQTFDITVKVTEEAQTGSRRLLVVVRESGTGARRRSCFLAKSRRLPGVWSTGACISRRLRRCSTFGSTLRHIRRQSSSESAPGRSYTGLAKSTS